MTIIGSRGCCCSAALGRLHEDVGQYEKSIKALTAMRDAGHERLHAGVGCQVRR